MDLGGYDYLLQSKGNFLYFAAIENFTMGKSTKMIEDGVVDSTPSRSTLPMIVSSPSPLRVKPRTTMRIISSKSDSRSSRKLYNSTSSSIPCRVLKVFFKNTFICRLFLWE
jgi:hypothetical protein